MLQIYIYFFAWFTSNLVFNVSITSQSKSCSYYFGEELKERSNRSNILQYVGQDAVTLGRHLGFGLSRRRKFFAARVGYYSNSINYFHQPRLILLSGDIELNPGMVGRQEKGNIKNIKIAHLNTRSLKNRAHYIQVKNLIIESDFDIFTISETWLNESVHDSEIAIPGYILYRLDRQARIGGGVCVFVKEFYKIKPLDKLSSTSNTGFQQLWLCVQIQKHKSFIICTAYRPPECTLDCFDTEFAESFVSASTLKKDIYILGDLNCNVLNSSDGGAKALLDFCSLFNLKQLIDQPTRTTELSTTLIDVVLVTNKSMVKSVGVTPVGISDHDLVHITLNFKKSRPKPIYISYRSFKHYDANEFARDISDVPWSVIDGFGDTEDKLEAFHLLFDPILDKHAPIKRVKLRARPDPFVTDEIKVLMQTRDEWRKLAGKTNNPNAWSSYRLLKRQIKHELREAEKEYVAKQIKENPNDSGCLWKVIRSCLPKKAASVKTFVKDEKVIANDFNKFFCSVGQNTVAKIHTMTDKFNCDQNRVPFVPRTIPQSDQFIINEVTQEEVKQIIIKMPLGKAPGSDKIPLRVIKDCLSAILTPLTSIINASFTSQVYPSRWKKAEVVPIPKANDSNHQQAENNRPISLLPILSKVCEKVVLNQFMPYLLLHNRLTANQSGNKQWHSTETTLIKTTDVILKAMDNRQLTAVVLLDMSKAFDSLDHGILISKLEDIGASSTALKWFTSYVTNRCQTVRINSTLSDTLELTNGVPQGSILGPLLFSIYINDLPSIPQQCPADCYVDDTKLYMCFPVRDYDLAMELMNDDLIRIQDWCLQNLLLLNPDKTHLMVYGTRQLLAKLPSDFSLSLLGEDLIPGDVVKDLGLTFDRNLHFNDHIVKVTASCMSILGQINRIKHVFTTELLIIIINALVFSKLFYCSSVWSSTSGKNIKKLQYIQNFAARIISGHRKYDHVTPILKELHWLPVKEHLYYRDAVLAFKCMNGMVPEYLSSQFTARGAVSGRKTRQSGQLNIPLFTSATGQKTFQYRITKIWNDLPSNLKLSRTISSFKTELKKILLNEFLNM